MIRTIFVWSCIVLSGFFFGSLAILSYLLDRKGEMAHVCARLWGKVCLLADGIHVRIEGLEQVPDKGPYIFMSNHQGSYDIFALMGRLPYQFKWLSKKEIFSIPIIGWAMSAAGYISIDRENAREALKAIEEASRRIREGTNIIIFPEGTRSADGKLLPFKKGGFTLALRAMVPVVPIGIYGSSALQPKGSSLPGKKGVIYIDIGDPIILEGMDRSQKTRVMDDVRTAIEALMAKGGSLSRRA